MNEPVIRPLTELSLKDLEQQLEAWGFRSFHAARVLREAYANGGELTESGRAFPKGLIARLKETFTVCIGAPMVASTAATSASSR